ncbi:MAG: hypothetical protein M0T74_12350 [Desulfitobacterium hafniense]|nr:hypothetical protein [Desulfitobacterium hafniense]
MPSETIWQRRVSERVLRSVNCAEGLVHGRLMPRAYGRGGAVHRQIPRRFQTQ